MNIYYKLLVLIFTLPALLIYLIGSFIHLSFNISSWTQDSRIFSVIIYIIVLIACLKGWSDTINDEQKKE